MSSPGLAQEVTVVGLGYVGLTVAVVLADAGFAVTGFDTSPAVVESLRKGRSHLFEPGVENLLSLHLGRNLAVTDRLPERIRGTVLICVSTPIEEGTHLPDLRNLEAAVSAIGARMADDVLVVVRSTVPVGTTRETVLPTLRAESGRDRVLLAFCPERTVQGQALREIRELPQVVGAMDEASFDAASRFFSRFVSGITRVRTLESAELVKLVNNAHTDYLYAFGNEVALMAEHFGLDPLDVIEGTNREYPRPNIARPGFVGGACLSKDPHMLVASFRSPEYRPFLISSARALNESLPAHMGERMLSAIAEVGKDAAHAKVFVCGFAYKGIPITDDLRGSPVRAFIDTIRGRVAEIVGHDPIVDRERVEAFGVPFASIDEGFADADAVVILNNHPDYRSLGEQLPQLVETSNKPLILVDCWRILDSRAAGSAATAIEAGDIGSSEYLLADDPPAASDPRLVAGLVYRSIGLVK